MKKTAFMFIVLALSLLPGCSGGDTAESMMKEITGNIKEMAAILTSITDEASAKAAVPKIDALRAKMRDAAKRAKNVPKIDAETEAKLNAEAETRMGEAIQAIGAAQERLNAQPELMAIIAPSLQGMENDM